MMPGLPNSEALISPNTEKCVYGKGQAQCVLQEFNIQFAELPVKEFTRTDNSLFSLHWTTLFWCWVLSSAQVPRPQTESDKVNPGQVGSGQEKHFLLYHDIALK